MTATGDFYFGSNTSTNNGTMSITGQLRLDGGTFVMGANSTTRASNKDSTDARTSRRKRHG